MSTYHIRRGDTLSHIARRAGTTVAALSELNGLANPDKIRAGAQLRLPGDAPSGTLSPERSLQPRQTSQLSLDGSPAAPRARGTAPLNADAVKPATTPAPAPAASGDAAQEQKRLANIARQRSAGRRPDGYCYRHVKAFLRASGSYGELVKKGIPDRYGRLAKQFAEYADKNLSSLGLKKLAIDNPYQAPPGAIVVVRPGTPGTRHPFAGDITVAGGDGKFYNGGVMRYGGPQSFPRGNRHVLGIYVPA